MFWQLINQGLLIQGWHLWIWAIPKKIHVKQQCMVAASCRSNDDTPGPILDTLHVFFFPGVLSQNVTLGRYIVKSCKIFTQWPNYHRFNQFRIWLTEQPPSFSLYLCFQKKVVECISFQKNTEKGALFWLGIGGVIQWRCNAHIWRDFRNPHISCVRSTGIQKKLRKDVNVNP